MSIFHRSLYLPSFVIIGQHHEGKVLLTATDSITNYTLERSLPDYESFSSMDTPYERVLMRQPTTNLSMSFGKASVGHGDNFLEALNAIYSFVKLDKE